MGPQTDHLVTHFGTRFQVDQVDLKSRPSKGCQQAGRGSFWSHLGPQKGHLGTHFGIHFQVAQGHQPQNGTQKWSVQKVTTEWSKNDPKNDQKMTPKIPKISKKLSLIRPYPHWSRPGCNGCPPIRGNSCNRPQNTPKPAQDSFKQPKIDPLLLKDRSKLAQTWTQGASRSPKET